MVDGCEAVPARAELGLVRLVCQPLSMARITRVLGSRGTPPTPRYGRGVPIADPCHVWRCHGWGRPNTRGGTPAAATKHVAVSIDLTLVREGMGGRARVTDRK